ncbi:hypothetical protein B9Z55_020494 [Caenorhabditis nigoni]|uniref:Uncharacterized protein n=1 Tax=Caenorhabditis nigoni TaxID=1611254 RepID=A0A2G5TN25_9PELO|nr:hypothetical protein B9Z55_020494 [Caenorhabditis nigoni]
MEIGRFWLVSPLSLPLPCLFVNDNIEQVDLLITEKKMTIINIVSMTLITLKHSMTTSSLTFFKENKDYICSSWFNKMC